MHQWCAVAISALPVRQRMVECAVVAKDVGDDGDQSIDHGPSIVEILEEDGDVVV